MNAPDRKVLDLGIPAFLERAEQAAVCLWSSAKRLVIVKDGDTVSLSPEDIKIVLDFVAMCNVEDQL